ncbi:MAG: Gfo/Idh/MocA family oxidoreductase [Prolixibacteraceae bacterium]|nr:Gfo/Idh/MocA family oxidoreductase [Prolixibacteraceae bacterium]
MSDNRRDFIKKIGAGAAGITVGSSVMGMSAKSYSRIIGANERLNVAIAGLGRRLEAYIDPIGDKTSNVELLYLCDVMKKQRERAAGIFQKVIDNKPVLENDFRKVLEDKNVDAIFVATTDHWHTPLAILAMKAGKNVYLEKPVSHNMWENELVVKCQKKYNKVVQMGAQQRSAPDSIHVIKEIHDGAIGTPYKALTFYVNTRGEVPVATKAPVPEGLDWELFQGPAPRQEYKHDTWDYNWHWYEWLYGTAETGNNATHEMDVARWALQVNYPESVYVEAAKRHFKDDGWTMYDTMDATFRFPGNLVIQWDGKSRSGHDTYGSDRGTIIYGSEGSVFVNRNGFKRFNRNGKLVEGSKSVSNEAGNALGGGGDMSTAHVQNFFNTIRGTEKLNLPIAEGTISQAMTHYANIAYRIGKGFEIDAETGKIFDREAMKLWGREYEPGWEPEI